MPKMIISLLLFGAIITGTFTLLANFKSDADNSEYAQYNRTLNKLDTIKSNSDSLRDSVRNSNPDEGVLGFLNGLIKTGWSALTQIWTSFTTLQTLLTDLPYLSAFPIPSWFTGALIGIVSIIIAFAIVMTILKIT